MIIFEFNKKNKKMSNVTFRTFSSDEKTDISHQRSLTNKMINDMKKLKNLKFLKTIRKN